MIAIKLATTPTSWRTRKPCNFWLCSKVQRCTRTSTTDEREGRDSFYTHHVYANEDNFHDGVDTDREVSVSQASWQTIQRLRGIKMSISTSAVLTELNISVWPAKKLDRATTATITANAVAVGDAAQVKKNLFAGTAMRSGH
jgi:hypothetical protein